MSSMKKWAPFTFEHIQEQQCEPSKNQMCKKALKKKAPNQNTPHRLPAAKNNDPKSLDFDFMKKIAPQTIEDIAVHPKKIAEVEAWLDQYVLVPHNVASLLLITGPSGCGKTITTQILCKMKLIGIAEWLNPVSSKYQQNGADHIEYVNQIERFTEFVVESSYANLFSSARHNLCLVKDFPNAFLRNPQDFLSVLEDISIVANVNVIFIATDDASKSINIERNLFPSEVKANYRIHTINFNPCAATLLKHAIKRAHTLLQTRRDLFDVPSTDVVEAICTASTGDIRCCVNQFYLAALKGGCPLQVEIKLQTSMTKIGSKRKRPLKTVALKSALKDESLGLFHSIGRVLHPKIDPDTGKIHHDVALLIDEFSTMPSVFLGFLQENYLRYFGDLTDAMHASKSLSLAQSLMDRWSERHESYIIGLYICVMGLMLANKHRISMWNPIRGPSKHTCEDAIINRETLQIVSPMDACYYNTIVKKRTFNRFAATV